MLDQAAQRRTMVDTQIRTYDVTSACVLEAIEVVPREAFVPEAMRGLAYTDTALAVHAATGEQRVLLQPMVLARMLQALDLQAGSRVLDVAGGSGYSAAVMHAMGASVHAVEETVGLTGLARQTLDAQGMTAVTTATIPFDSAASEGPFDAICVNGACAAAPDALLAALANGGRLVAIIGQGRAGRVTLFTRSGDTIGQRIVFDASAPPLAAFAARPGFTL